MLRSLISLVFFCCSAAQVIAQYWLVESGGTFRADATNLAAGATAIGQDELSTSDALRGVSGTPHTISKINDGTYGNASSWIGADILAPYTIYTTVIPGFPPMPTGIGHNVVTQPSNTSWVGVQFDAPVTVASFALGRDNTGAISDRVPTSYLVQYATTPGEWADLVTIDTSLSSGTALRNLYNLETPLDAVIAIRIVTGTGIHYGAAIDELEVYSTTAIPEPSTYAALAGLAALALVAWRRRTQAITTRA